MVQNLVINCDGTITKWYTRFAGPLTWKS